MSDGTNETRGRDGAFRGLLGVVVAVLLVPMGIAGLRTYQDLVRADERKAALAEEIARAQRDIERLERRIADLESRPATVERLARADLGMVYPGEVVIVLPPVAEPPPVSEAQPSGDRPVPAGPRPVDPAAPPRGGAPLAVSAVSPSGGP